MNQLRILTSLVAVSALLTFTAGLSADPPDLCRESAPAQDGRSITKLRWMSPNGELPTTYAEYINHRPDRPARFSKSLAQSDPAKRSIESLSILVDASLYPQIASSLDAYITDVEAAGHAVFMQSVSGGSPAEIKAWVIDQYGQGATGVLFVGDITAAWAEVSGSVFPCDLFYMDLDGYWEDGDADGVYETHQAGTGDEGPELYIARIYAHTLTYDSEANMVTGYFGKTHAYRTGALYQPWRALEYVDEDWYTMNVHQDLIYDGDVTRYDLGYLTTGADYLNKMDLGQHFVQVCAHSYSGGHHFSRRPTESATYAHVYIHSPTLRIARLHLGADDGIKVWFNADNVLTEDVYGGWTPDQWTTDVLLNEGWNQLLCKISQGGGDYSFSSRITDQSGDAIPGLTYQLDDPQTHGAQGQFITNWLLSGFHQDISDNFWNYLTTNYLGTTESAINPSDGDIMGGETWTTYNAQGSYVDMSAYDDSDFGASYAFARVYVASQTSCQLWIGYEDGARVWLNGNQVLYDNRYGGFEADMSRVNITLNAGENHLLVKVSEWMGAHGFSARFCYADGGIVEDILYDPPATPITYISTWLLNGPYANEDQATRLSTDYLGGEATVVPSEGEGDPAWTRGILGGYPVDLVMYYNHGDWVFSQDIQDRDPPVLFYNLFSCGPGRFVDENYLAGAYIFNTTFGLITVASAKSGSMLQFDDFTRPLGEGETIGAAYREWFDAQAPFETWEREWYYGMVLNGDPLLLVAPRGDLDGNGCVNQSDLGILLACYNIDEGGDLDGDGDTDQADLGILLANYDKGC
ncbi:MAG: hypothetical protein KAS72_13570 [Phycisphaerales bacterium]|nr:hypothetical protein [Phycisphaerales bacterium]